MHQRISEGSLICSKETSGTASWMNIPLSDCEARAIVTTVQPVPSRGRRVNTRWAGEKGIGKGLIISIMLHAAVIAVAIVCSTNYVKKHQETITVFLADSESPAERGPAGKAPAQITKKVVSPAMTRVDRGGRLNPAVPEPAKRFVPETKNETPTNKASAAVSSTLSVSSADRWQQRLLEALPKDEACKAQRRRVRQGRDQSKAIRVPPRVTAWPIAGMGKRRNIWPTISAISAI